MKKPELSLRVSDCNFTGLIALVVVLLPACLVLFSVVNRILLQSYVLAEKNQPNNPSIVAAATIVHHGETAWGYDFTTMPNGPLYRNQWHFERGNTVADYNNEAQTYTDRKSNVRIENGALVIEAKPENLNNKQYTSARIDSKGVFDFTYGTLEVDMMLPSGTGTWPAAWLLPANNIYKPESYGISNNDSFSWALNGEIDFVEAVGKIPNQNIPAAHSYNEVKRSPTYTPGIINDAYDTYHHFGIIKQPNSITFTIDGKPYASRQKSSSNPLDWPYDQPYYLVINLAIGGNWAGSDGIDNTTAPWLLKIRNISYKPLQ